MPDVLAQRLASVALGVAIGSCASGHTSPPRTASVEGSSSSNGAPATDAPARDAAELLARVERTTITLQGVVVERSEQLPDSIRQARAGATVARVVLVPGYDEATLGALLFELERGGLEAVRLEASARPLAFGLVKPPAKPRFVILRHEDRLALGERDESGVGNRATPWRPGDREAEGAVRARIRQCAGRQCVVQVSLTSSGVPGFLVEALASWDRISGGLADLPASVTFPNVKRGATTVSGTLPPAEIQRVVRSHFEKFRSCYEAGLARDPALRGQVRVRFVIDREGKVSAIQDGGSDLPDAAVVSCVLDAFKTIVFPPPVGGVVTVVYPIQLEPG